MKCPDCNQRNSVAAAKCFNCGQILPRKPIPKIIKISVLVFVSLLILTSLVIKIALSNLSLTKSTSVGALNSDESKQDWEVIKTKLKTFLITRLNLTKPNLEGQLQGFLKDNTLEIHIFELPEGLKVVEIGKNLMSSLFLLDPNALPEASSKLIEIAQINVFEGGKVFEVGKQKWLVLMGHNSSELNHLSKPVVINIQTAEDISNVVLPKLPDNTIYSLDLKSGLFTVKFPCTGLLQIVGLDTIIPNQLKAADETITGHLLLQKNKYFNLAVPYYKYQLGPIYVLSKIMLNPSSINDYKDFIGTSKFNSIVHVLKNAKSTSSNEPFTFKLEFLSKKIDGHNNYLNYLLESNQASYKVQIICTKASGNTLKYLLGDVKLESKSKVVDTASQETDNLDNTTSSVQENKTKPDEKLKPQTVVDLRTPAQDLKSDQSVAPIEEPLSKTPLTTDYNEASTFSKINVRQQPTLDSKVVCHLPANKDLIILSQSAGWYKIKTKANQIGYVYAGLLKAKFPNAYNTASIVKSSMLEDAQHKTIGSLNSGDRVVILQGLTNKKYKIKLANGKEGYIAKSAIDVSLELPQFVP